MSGQQNKKNYVNRRCEELNELYWGLKGDLGRFKKEVHEYPEDHTFLEVQAKFAALSALKRITTEEMWDLKCPAPHALPKEK
jgi:hypothetical protein